jgi:hypothetical protein
MSRSERDPRIEWIKLVAIFAVAFQHLSHAPELWIAKQLTHGAVPAFTFLSVFFSAQAGLRATNFWAWLRTRVFRLYGLFLIWNTLYFSLRMFSSGAGAPSTFKGFSATNFFLVGYDNALWFIPFILIANSIGFAIAYALKCKPRTRIIGLSMLLGAGALAIAISPWVAALQFDLITLGLARKAVPAGLLGISLGLMGRNMDSFCSHGRGEVALYALIFGASGYALVAYGRCISLPETLVGMSGIAIALRLVPKTAVAVNPELTLFVFVAHSLFIHGLRKGGFFLGYDWGKASATANLIGFAALVALMTGCYFLIRNNFVGSVALARWGPPSKRLSVR